MNIVSDESVERAVTQRLRDLGHDVYAIVELEPGSSDEIVLSRANAKQRLLLTMDKDFGELVFRLQQASYGVILVRLFGTSTSEKADRVAEVIEKLDEQLYKSFTVITSQGVRSRQLF